MKTSGVGERVAAGAAWLDEQFGPDWPQVINLYSLDLSNGESCVLGQLYREDAKGLSPAWNGYGVGATKVCAQGLWPGDLGFLAGDVGYDALQEEWAKVIAERQEDS